MVSCARGVLCCVVLLFGGWGFSKLRYMLSLFNPVQIKHGKMASKQCSDCMHVC